MATELINKLNFLEDEDQEAPPAMSTNPFDEPDDDIHPNHLNPFGDPDEGTYSSAHESNVHSQLGSGTFGKEAESMSDHVSHMDYFMAHPQDPPGLF